MCKNISYDINAQFCKKKGIQAQKKITKYIIKYEND
jgi:hypothetical protein